ncbi:MAG: site-specific integrase [Candidatus Thioglobus sp.]|jgi:integrase|nr:site-specific integrase [Candidatus Thioglobus sp.]
MAYIQKVTRKKDIVYRAYIKKAGVKRVTKTFKTKRLAVQFINSIESDRIKLSSYNDAKPQTKLSIVVDQYLSEEYKGSRLKDERRKLNFWTEHIGDKQIRDIIKSDIDTALSHLPKQLSNATINRYKAAASVVFNYACREFDLPDNPVRHIRSLSEPRGRIRFLSDDERSRLFKAVRQSSWDKLYLLVLLAITTGARKGELVSLRWNTVDLERQTAFVSTTKNGQSKVLPLTDSVVVELRKFVKQDDSLIFNSEITTDSPFCFYKQWKKALLSADIQSFRFHDLRHTTASYLAQSGASLLEIADVLGHKQIQMTKRYSHLCVDHKQKLVNNVLGGISDTVYVPKPHR